MTHLSDSKLHLAASVIAQCSPGSVRNYLLGKPMRSTTQLRIEDALRRIARADLIRRGVAL